VTLARQLLIGVGANLWWKRELGLDATIAVVSGLVALYPIPSSGLHVEAGGGYQAYRAEVCIPSCAESQQQTFNQSGLGLLAGVGYDIRLTDRFSLTPVARFLFAVGGRLRLDDNELGDANANFAQIGLAATLH
jgi:hypothetical protein